MGHIWLIIPYTCRAVLSFFPLRSYLVEYIYNESTPEQEMCMLSNWNNNEPADYKQTADVKFMVYVTNKIFHSLSAAKSNTYVL